MLARLHELASRRRDFAFETTMASRSFAPWLRGLVDEGYLLHLVFLWISSPEEALLRHKKLGQSIVVCRDGVVVEIPPEEIPV